MDGPLLQFAKMQNMKVVFDYNFKIALLTYLLSSIVWDADSFFSIILICCSTYIFVTSGEKKNGCLYSSVILVLHQKSASQWGFSCVLS